MQDFELISCNGNIILMKAMNWERNTWSRNKFQLRQVSTMDKIQAPLKLAVRKLSCGETSIMWFPWKGSPNYLYNLRKIEFEYKSDFKMDLLWDRHIDTVFFELYVLGLSHSKLG